MVAAAAKAAAVAGVSVVVSAGDAERSATRIGGHGITGLCSNYRINSASHTEPLGVATVYGGCTASAGAVRCCSRRGLAAAGANMRAFVGVGWEMSIETHSYTCWCSCYPCCSAIGWTVASLIT